MKIIQYQVAHRCYFVSALFNKFPVKPYKWTQTCILLILFGSSSPVFIEAQATDSLKDIVLKEVILSDTRINNTVPWTYAKDTIGSVDVYQTSLRSAFNRQTGVQAFNGENFAQDIRISIRGYGGRSAFGIRGIRMYMDGVPMSSPDGTTQIDELSIFDINSMEMIRSGMAARFGNSAGGTISLRSNDFFHGLTFRTGLTTFGAYNVGLKVGAQKGKWSHLTSVNHHFFKSAREHSAAQNSTFYNKTRISINDHWQLNVNTGFYYSPVGEDPGSLTIKETEQDLFQANVRNKLFNAGESVHGFLGAVSSRFTTNNLVLRNSMYYRRRNFEARLPFEAGGWVNLNRDFIGLTHSLDYQLLNNALITVGQSTEYQDDRRILSNNKNSSKGNNTADQNERVFNIGLYQQSQWKFSDIDIHQLIRFDINRYTLTDYFPADGNQDGDIKYNNVNGAIGVGYHGYKYLSFFANLSTAFEMPTLNELTNNPSGAGGFNDLLSAEKSIQSEVGIKYAAGDGRLTVSGAFFYILLTNQIQGYELPAFPGRTYYRNAAKTSRNGIEVDISYLPAHGLALKVNYMYSDFRYGQFVAGTKDYSGNRQTLIPVHKANVHILTNLLSLVEVDLLAGYVGAMWLDDANTVKSDWYPEINATLTTSPGLFKKVQAGIQINNMFSLMKYSNFRANAAALRYYEGASPMHFGFFVSGKLK
jgi:iron complex outermembrane receptor protein